MTRCTSIDQFGKQLPLLGAISGAGSRSKISAQLVKSLILLQKFSRNSFYQHFFVCTAHLLRHNEAVVYSLGIHRHNIVLPLSQGIQYLL